MVRVAGNATSPQPLARATAMMAMEIVAGAAAGGGGAVLGIAALAGETAATVSAAVASGAETAKDPAEAAAVGAEAPAPPRADADPGLVLSAVLPAASREASCEPLVLLRHLRMEACGLDAQPAVRVRAGELHLSLLERGPRRSRKPKARHRRRPRQREELPRGVAAVAVRPAASLNGNS